MSGVILAASEGSSSGISTAVSEIMGVVTTMLNTITGNPLLMIFFSASIVSIAIGIVMKLKAKH